MLSESSKNILIKLTESINPNQFKGLTTKIKYLYPLIFNELKRIQLNKKIKTFSEVLYLAINDLEDIPECYHYSKNCSGNLKFKNIIEGYYPYCKACSSCNPDFIQNRYETNMDRYDFKYPTKNKYILEKIKNTVLRKYNVNNVKQIKKDL